MTWKDIPSYENEYQINTNGDIKSLKTNKTLKWFINNKNGYAYVTLCKNNKRKCYRVHKLVAITYLKNTNNKSEINHINGNKLDNRIENLEWCSSSENQKHAYKIGLQKPIMSKNNKLSKKTIQYDLDYNIIKIWDSLSDIVRELNIKKQYISACCLGKIKKTCNYIFKYVEEVD